MTLSTRIAIVVVANLLLAVVLTVVPLQLTRTLGLPYSNWLAGIFAFAIALPIALASARTLARRVTWPLIAISDGIRGFRDGDYSIRLHARGTDEIGELVKLYNEVGERLRSQRTDIYQKELLLDTILQRSPIGVLLVGLGHRVIYSNVVARELLAGGARLDGRKVEDIVTSLAEPLRNAFHAEGNAIITMPAGADSEETFLFSQRHFRLNTQPHRLVLIERLTPELRRQEVAVWKKAIRLMNHELNNSIAPISSLFHSARTIQDRPDQQHRLGEIYEVIEERLAYLRMFLESYAQFARLPAPRRERASWHDLLDEVHALYPFELNGAPPDYGSFDRAQLQQVLINLVKNAHESGSDPKEVVVHVARSVDGTMLRVLDRGKGMDDATMRRALLPFYSTKPGGTGIGLALSNEILEAHGGRLNIQAREGGGAVVTCWLPD